LKLSSLEWLIHTVKLRFLCLLAILLASSDAQAAFPTTQPFPGITFAQQARQNPPTQLFWVQVDLTNPAIRLRVCPGGTSPPGDWETTLLPVSKIAAREHLDVAVNGSMFAPKDIKELFGVKIPYFEGNPAREIGYTVSDGRLWSHHPLEENSTTLLVTKSGQVSIENLSDAPTDAEEAVSGRQIVRDGTDVGPDDPTAPRTAVGLDAARKKLTLLVVDGRRPGYSMGLTLKQLGSEMLKLGCTSAISLDGGGSTTLVMRNNQKWRLINTPSDGHTFAIPLCIERSVGCALGVTVERESGK
jgi:hypothetical protein